ncbi:hypothetical protein HaLaN_04202 [Haematococcus lacustris]|uniref:Uncharacterized protein n=1 Tax=Haematococcus lacustris TaxID=44745 RepID=A0A699YIQ7_HAELA|nr:hypothetical protein HaLaN_04202 [Haematococcus lacustris]
MQQLQAEVEALYSSRSGSARLVWLQQQVVPGSRAAASQRRRQAVGGARRQQPRPAALGVGGGQGQACQVQAGQLGMQQHPGQQAQELGQQQQQGPETTRPKAISHCPPAPASTAAPPSLAEAAAAVQVEAMDGPPSGSAAEGGAAAVGLEAGTGQQPGSAAGSEAAEAAVGPEASAAPSPPAPPLQPQWLRCRLLLTRSCGRRDALFSDVASPVLRSRLRLDPVAAYSVTDAATASLMASLALTVTAAAVAAIELDPDRAADLLLNLRLRGLVPPPLAAGRARAVAGGGGGVDPAAALLGQGRARVVALKLPAKDISARCVELAEQVATEAARNTVASDTDLDDDRGAAGAAGPPDAGESCAAGNAAQADRNKRFCT